jgi:group I intron endonuclease
METYGYIYQTENKINGKRYIGQHKSKSFDTKYYGSGKILKQAIQKYGKEKFSCFPLAWAFNKEELDKLEIEYIAHYRPEYNLTKGGDGGCGTSGKNHPNYGKKCSEETRKKMSEKKKGKKLSNEHKEKIGKASEGRHHTEEIRKKLRELNKGENNPMYGKHFSKEHKRKIGEANKISRVGMKFSEEHKRRISESLKKYFENRKAA